MEIPSSRHYPNDCESKRYTHSMRVGSVRPDEVTASEDEELQGDQRSKTILLDEYRGDRGDFRDPTHAESESRCRHITEAEKEDSNQPNPEMSPLQWFKEMETDPPIHVSSHGRHRIGKPFVTTNQAPASPPVDQRAYQQDSIRTL